MSNRSGGVIRIGCVNCGGRVGWSMGVEFFRRKYNLDLMFVLDTRKTTSSRPIFKNLIGETFSAESHSSMLVVGEEPIRWRVIGFEEDKEGCFIKVSDGVNRIAGMYLRPNIRELTTTMNRRIDLALEWLQPAGILIGDFNARHRSRDARSNARGNYLHRKLLHSPCRIEVPSEPTFTTTAGRGGEQGGQSLVDLVIQRGFRGRILTKDTKDDMRADHKAIMFEATRTTIPRSTERKDHKTVLRTDLQKGMRQEDIEGLETMMVNEIGLYNTGDEESGPKDVLQRVILSNMATEQTGRKLRRKMFWRKECEVAEKEYLKARREYEANQTDELREVMRQKAKVKRRTIIRCKRKVWKANVEELMNVTSSELAATVATLRSWTPKHSINASAEEFMNILKEKMGNCGRTQAGFGAMGPGLGCRK